MGFDSQEQDKGREGGRLGHDKDIIAFCGKVLVEGALRGRGHDKDIMLFVARYLWRGHCVGVVKDNHRRRRRKH